MRVCVCVHGHAYVRARRCARLPGTPARLNPLVCVSSPAWLRLVLLTRGGNPPLFQMCGRFRIRRAAKQKRKPASETWLPVTHTLTCIILPSVLYGFEYVGQFPYPMETVSGAHLDYSRAPYVLYGVKCIDLVSRAPYVLYGVKYWPSILCALCCVWR